MSLTAIKNLGPWIPKPTVIVPVLDFVEASERPVTCGEVAKAIGIRAARADMCLRRLTEKGLLQRWKAPMLLSHPALIGPKRSRVAGRFRCNVWLYAATKE